MERISNQYYRDGRCEEIEDIIHKDSHFDKWTVLRFRTLDSIGTYEDSFEIRDPKGHRILVLSASELDFAIASGMLYFILEQRRKLGFLRNMGPRGMIAAILLIIIVPVVLLIPLLMYIISLPAEQGFLGLMTILGLCCCFSALLYFSQRKEEQEQTIGEHSALDRKLKATTSLTLALDRVQELEELKENNPEGYLEKIQELEEELRESGEN